MKRDETARERRHAPVQRPFRRLAAALGAVALALAAAHAGLLAWRHACAAAHGAASVAAPIEVRARDERGTPAEPSAAPRYRWLDRDAGIAEIPVERAMRLLAVGDEVPP